MAYYHDIITQKSWEELTKLTKVCKFVLIGGWATYLYTRSLKSKDIDILIDYSELGKLQKNYQITKNERLKKYEARHEEIQIDIYLPHYSEIGIPVEKLINQTNSLEGFMVVKKEWLIALKTYVFSQRFRSVKGEKDFLDLLSLFINNIDLKKVIQITKKYKIEKTFDFFTEFMKERTEAPEIGLNKHNFKKIKEEIIL